MTCKNCNNHIHDEGIPLVKGKTESELTKLGLPYIVIVQCGECQSTFSTETVRA